MTDPNPLKQAAEEAKARKLAEVVTREATLQVVDPLFESEIRQARERVTEPLVIVKELDFALRDGERYDAAMKRNGVADDPNAQSVQELMSPHDPTYPGRHVHIAVLRVRSQETDLAYKDIRSMLRDAELIPAGIRELAEVAGTSRDLFSEGDVIVGFGQVLTTPVPGVGVWRYRYPILKYKDGAIHQDIVEDFNPVAVPPSVIYIPVVLADRSLQPAP